MINDEYELCFSGQLDSISPDAVDTGKDLTFYVTVRVTDFVNTKGTYSLQAACPEDYHGEHYLEWELTSGTYGETKYYGKHISDTKYPLRLEELNLVADKYSSLISSELWDIIISEQNEEAYDYAEENQYDDF
jgi:hypothetical protein